MLKKIFLFIIIASLASCNLTYLVSNKSALTETQTIQTDLNSLYDRIAVASDRTYSTYQTDYTNIEIEIDTLISHDKVRKHAGIIVTQVQQLQNLFTELDGEHKLSVTISPAEARTNKSYCRSAINNILKSENSLP